MAERWEPKAPAPEHEASGAAPGGPGHEHEHAHGSDLGHGHEHEHAAAGSGPHRPVGGETSGWTRAVLLLGLGLYLGYLFASESVGNYVNLRFGWLALAGALLSLALGGHALMTQLRAGRSPSAASHDHEGHAHQPLGWPALGLLAAPLALGILVPSQPLGAAAVAGDISLPRGASEGAVLLAADSAQWTVIDWLRMFSSPGGGDRLQGQPADITGFVYRQEGDPDGYFVVARFLMVHCTADAYAVGMPVVWPEAQALPSDTWVRVRGTVQVGDFRGNVLPILAATSVDDRAERPKQVYLYQ